jgi:hypothetical protein
MFVEKLEKMGVRLYSRPDIYDGNNNCIAVVIDEREDRFVMKDPITFVGSTECVEEFLYFIFDQYHEGFIVDVIHGINEYLYDHSRVAKKFNAKEWWGVIISTIILALERYGIDLEDLDAAEYAIAKKRLGGRKGIRTFVRKALENKDLCKCAICENCRINLHGDYICKCIIVESDRTNGSIIAKLMTGNQFASNRCEDIMKYDSTCDRFSTRKTVVKRIAKFFS